MVLYMQLEIAPNSVRSVFTGSTIQSKYLPKELFLSKLLLWFDTTVHALTTKEITIQDSNAELKPIVPPLTGHSYPFLFAVAVP